jgi:phosphatidylglycerophosphate synthase
MVSVFSIALGLIAAYLASLPEASAGLWAGAVLIAVRFIDCVDGELARLKYMGSRLGAWLDTLGDGVGIFAFVLGVWMHVLATDPADVQRWQAVGAVGLASWVIVQVAQVLASRQISGSGSVQEIAWGHLQAERTWSERLVAAVAVFARIDTIGVAYGILTMAGLYRVLLVVHAVSATLGALYFSLQLVRNRVGKVSVA